MMKFSTWAAGPAAAMACGCLMMAAPAASGQASGEFVIPAERGAEGHRFSYWDRFQLPPGSASSYLTDHIPNLLGLGDDDGNASNYNGDVRLVQVLTPNTFVTSSGAIYSFAGKTGFELHYRHVGEEPVSGVVWQVLTAGPRVLEESVRLEYTPADGGEVVSLAPAFRALEEPGTGGFAERALRGWEWDLSGLDVGDYRIYFESESSSMALYEAQLDTGTAAQFSRSLGWLLETGALPRLRFGVGGQVARGVPSGAEKRFFGEGAEVELSASAAGGFEAVGWVGTDGAVVADAGPLTVVFDEENPEDLRASAVFSPASWEAFRNHWFNHANTLTGTADDHLDELVSGLAADPDGDDASNFVEYAFGGDPMVPDSGRSGVEATLVTSDGRNWPGITYRCQAAGSGDLRYVVEQSSGLSGWSSGTAEAPLTSEVSRVLQADGTCLVTVRSLTPPAHTPQFLRVRAVLANP